MSTKSNCVIVANRELDLDLGADEILADGGHVFRDKKSPNTQLEMAIGDGMEFTIHGAYLSEPVDQCLTVFWCGVTPLDQCC